MKALSKKNIFAYEDFDNVKTERNVLRHGKDCKFLTKLLCCFQNSERIFIVMEFLSGGDLLFHLEKVNNFLP